MLRLKEKFEEIRNKKLQDFLNHGWSEEDAKHFANTYITSYIDAFIIGYSESGCDVAPYKDLLKEYQNSN